LKTAYTIRLKEDYYSLAFFGYYLDTDEEDTGPWHSTKEYFVDTVKDTESDKEDEEKGNKIDLNFIKNKLKMGISNAWMTG